LFVVIYNIANVLIFISNLTISIDLLGYFGSKGSLKGRIHGCNGHVQNEAVRRIPPQKTGPVTSANKCTLATGPETQNV
jgi:hypothetical protein